MSTCTCMSTPPTPLHPLEPGLKLLLLLLAPLAERLLLLQWCWKAIWHSLDSSTSWNMPSSLAVKFDPHSCLPVILRHHITNAKEVMLPSLVWKAWISQGHSWRTCLSDIVYIRILMGEEKAD